jgi:hypothetical protein
VVCVIVCKVCGATNEQGATFCGTCGSFLEWSGEAVQPDGSTPPPGAPDGPPPGPAGQQPGAAGAAAVGAAAGAAASDETTAMATSATPSTDPAPPGSIICPNCGQANDPTRVYCSRCATELAPAAAASDAVVAAPPASGGIPPVAILGAVGAVAVLGVLAFVFLLPKGGETPSSEANVSDAPSASVASVQPSVEASSVAPSGDVGSASPSVGPTPALPVPTGRIVFTARQDGNSDVMVWSADDGVIDALVDGKGDQSDPAWAPDGSMVVYVEGTPPFSPNGGTPNEGLRVVNDDGSEADPFDFTHHDVDRNPAWSPGDDVIAFASTRDHTQNKNLDIYSRPFKTTTDEKLLVDDGADDWDPTWSESGNAIVFVSERNGDARLFTMRPNGGNQEALKLGSGIFDDPAFSPDGEHLAFTRRDNEDAAKQLFVADADGSDMQQLGEFDADVSDPTWSPDSKLIALTRGDGGSMIVIVDAATGTQVDEFGVDGASNMQPDWK